jgi:hypothetical protein
MSQTMEIEGNRRAFSVKLTGMATSQGILPRTLFATILDQHSYSPKLIDGIAESTTTSTGQQAPPFVSTSR